jgi:hypothetical protein
MKEMTQEEYLKYYDIGIAMSEKNKQDKQTQEPFLRRLLLDREQCNEVEQNLYNFIYYNWTWCLPVYKNAGTPGRVLIGYRMLDKESIMRQVFNFG